MSILAGVILAFFTIALVFRLPDLVFTGQKAIGAAWLLWLIAVVVPLTVIVAMTALYALLMRSRHYGLTVERVWAFVVAGAALLYAVGYSIAAFGRGVWLGSISRANVIVALAQIAVIAATLTPVLSPYRLAANSQFELVRDNGLAVEEDKLANRYGAASNTPLHYLRFDSGRYGQERLRELAELQTGKDATGVRLIANRLLAQKARWEPAESVNIRADIAKMPVYPEGSVLDKELVETISKDLEKPDRRFAFRVIGDQAVGIYVDLNGDGTDEFVIVTKDSGVVYERQAGRWVPAGNVVPEFAYSARRDLDLAAELAKGKIAAIRPKWNDLSVDGFLFSVRPLMNGWVTVGASPRP